MTNLHGVVIQHRDEAVDLAQTFSPEFLLKTGTVSPHKSFGVTLEALILFGKLREGFLFQILDAQ